MSQVQRPPQKGPSLLLFVVLVGLLLLLGSGAIKEQSGHVSEITFSEFTSYISNPDRSIKELTIQGQDITGTLSNGDQFKTYGPISEELQKTLTSKGVSIKFLPPEKPSLLGQLLFSLLPILIMVLLLVWLFRSLGNRGGGSNTMAFGKSKAKLAENTNVTFKDVAGVDEAKEELEEVVDFLKNPSQFTKLGGKIPKGLLMVGSPGCGKTLLAKAVAGEAGVPFFSISGSDFVEMFVGVGASRVRDLFAEAKKKAPCIIFIDEIDAVGRRRGAGTGGGNDEREQTLNQLLVEMDGFEENKGIIMIAATNRVDVLDPALLRPGRFDRQVFVSNPDVKGRKSILQIHSRRVPLAEEVDLSIVAKGTPGFSGADLENLVNEAALIAARNKENEVTNHHLDLAKDKITMGPARKSMVFSEKEKRTTAYHEIGHALVGWFTEAADPVHKVTIIPRGRALGVTMLLPEEDKLSYSAEQALATIDYAMGGRAAEELIFGHLTTGASNDIEKATDIARKMVCNWGMSGIGPLNFAIHGGGDPFMGAEMGRQVVHSEELAKKIDNAVIDIVNKSYGRALALLRGKKELLHKLSEALIEKETLLHEEIKEIIESEATQ